MSKSSKFSPKVRARAIRMVQEQRGEYPSLWAAIDSIAPKIGCVPQTLLEWVKQAEVDSGQCRELCTSPLVGSARMRLDLCRVAEAQTGVVCAV